MIKVTLKINKTFDKKLEKIKEFVPEHLESLARDMAVDAPALSKYFVDTGAFITSWQITDGRSGRPRGKSSHGLPRNKGNDSFAEGKRQESQEQLMGDVARIDFKNTKVIVLRNGAPHALYVDAKHNKVMAQLRNKYGRY